MHVPLVSDRAQSYTKTLDRILGRRSPSPNPIPVPQPKGGGGGGHAASGSHGSSGHSSESTGHSTSGAAPRGSRGSSIPTTGRTFGRTTATSYGSGSTKVFTIPQGQPFAGRTYGGGTRAEIYGTTVYGSGYPGLTSLGVADRGFPFIFYPVVWGPGRGYGAPYFKKLQYGEPDNSTRPGGPEMQATFTSSISNSTFHVVADNSTVLALIASIAMNCTADLGANSSQIAVPFNDSATDPLPEQAVQYYRASSVVLTLEGYNNTAALTGDANATAVPLPADVDERLLNCLNYTIGESVPVFDSAFRMSGPSMVGLLGLPYLILCLLYL